MNGTNHFYINICNHFKNEAAQQHPDDRTLNELQKECSSWPYLIRQIRKYVFDEQMCDVLSTQCASSSCELVQTNTHNCIADGENKTESRWRRKGFHIPSPHWKRLMKCLASHHLYSEIVSKIVTGFETPAKGFSGLIWRTEMSAVWQHILSVTRLKKQKQSYGKQPSHAQSNRPEKPILQKTS